MSIPSPIHHGPGARRPSEWVRRWARRLAPGARVLDFAAGSGRNAAPLLDAGARVTAADLDGAALALWGDPLDGQRGADGLPAPPGPGAAVERVVADLERGPWPFEAARFDAVVCCNYLFRPRLDLLFGLLAPGGLMIYETFARGNERYGKPSNPAFLLAEGELGEAARRNGFTVLAYEHGYAGPARPALVQRLAAARPPFDPERYPVVG
jgi:SAM-dependent methyltransferase